VRSGQAAGKPARTFIDEARRAQLVQCAIEAIDEVGYQRASLAEIAKRAGITKAAIFYHFANRDELIGEVIATITAKGAEHMMPRVTAAERPPEQLQAYIEAFVSAIAVDSREVRTLYAIGQHFSDLRDNNEALRDATVAPLESILREGQEAGEFRAFNTRTMALTINAALEAILPQTRWYPDLDLSAYSRDLVEIFDRATRKT